jgi:hypothetical protein
MQADIHLTGTVAQLSRGLLPEVSRKLTQQFADCLARSMGAAEVVATESADVADEARADQAPVRAKPIGGFRSDSPPSGPASRDFFRKLFGGKREG